jgi:hypothetical protein
MQLAYVAFIEKKKQQQQNNNIYLITWKCATDKTHIHLYNFPTSQNQQHRPNLHTIHNYLFFQNYQHIYNPQISKTTSLIAHTGQSHFFFLVSCNFLLITSTITNVQQTNLPERDLFLITCTKKSRIRKCTYRNCYNIWFCLFIELFMKILEITCTINTLKKTALLLNENLYTMEKKKKKKKRKCLTGVKYL